MVPVKHLGRLILFSAAGLMLFIFFNYVQPHLDSGIDFSETTEAVSKQEAQEIAVSFLEARFSVGPWDAFVLYDANADASGYLTKEAQLERYEETWAQEAPLEYWRVEAQDHAKTSVFHVLIHRDKPSVFGFEHKQGVFPHTNALALKHTEQLLSDMGYKLADYSWWNEETGLRLIHQHKLGEAELQVYVQAEEGIISAVYPVIKLPQAFTDWKQAQDAKGAITSLFSLLLWFGLMITAIIFMAVYRTQMQFSRGIWLSLAFLIPYVIYTVSMYPGIKLSAPAMDGAVVFGLEVQQFVNMLLAISVYVCLVAGEGMWRSSGFDLWPHHRETRFRSIVMRSVGLGYLFCFIIIGLQSVIFTMGIAWFDVWFGIDPTMSSHNLLWPSTYPLLAWSAAISEEAVFRLFAIILFIYAIRPFWRWVARLTRKPGFLHPLFYLIPSILITSVIWALAHTNYSVYPVYTRLVEVAILGVVFSIILIKYGLLAAIFAHATVDLLLMGLEIMTIGGEYMAVGLFYLLMPLLIGLLLQVFVPPHKPKPPADTDGSLVTLP